MLKTSFNRPNRKINSSRSFISGISKDQRKTTFETIIQKLDSISLRECSDIAEMQSGERIAFLLACNQNSLTKDSMMND